MVLLLLDEWGKKIMIVNFYLFFMNLLLEDMKMMMMVVACHGMRKRKLQNFPLSWIFSSSSKKLWKLSQIFKLAILYLQLDVGGWQTWEFYPFWKWFNIFKKSLIRPHHRSSIIMILRLFFQCLPPLGDGGGEWI